ncbi:crossover junction endodeoxyribonuclease RuvC [Sulfobacillus thermosulfidooxidans]|uniref:Crossover junction endodeoxyribonuclease RuvC n=2 Tax=Sulfobacillus thermosulfidooxidans TaxID=28034 RepID=A0A1W1W5P4_SULTA|nr:crossover junction endodeoxyribonuclease RuvC [Sulfobacillus thermosulfidooxidans]OLZ09818.1 crossover junction endodeoxyribonuclease RuvC [Sulfobacillus thermosulfidooxidans]OLZ15876.1 crossover junction endodeoxyribonuclease RuvC [Sulfobacillus thermosulfidooxidans]OLZ18277.1 crossover junction endodeoxyribonuclease RuvC [Sulfobacillus thermosulfidooxidans]PSR25654.1 MAG: crossover junction endodeoxyribonuclease RuvC [Sulfobacillus thermosulfidooxidans]SMC01604.1 Holliday junction endonuc
MRILGIDPGTAICGWAIVDKERHESLAVDYGAILTPGDLPAAQRLERVYDELLAIIDRYRPEYGAVEKLFFGQNTKTALAVGQARGVVLLALSQRQVSLVEMAPTEVKQTVTGYGRADKHQVQLMVTRLLHLPKVPKPDDVADALAIAMTGLEWVKYREVLRD